MALDRGDYPSLTDPQWEDVVEIAMVIGPEMADRVADSYDTLESAKKVWIVGGDAAAGGGS